MAPFANRVRGGRYTFQGQELQLAQNWNEKETITTDGPHSYNMGFVEEITNNGTAVRLSPRMFPPSGATLLVLGGPGAGQTRLVTGRNASGGPHAYTLERPFDGFLVPNVSKLAALPTVGKKLIIGNAFHNTEVVQYYANNIRDVTADNVVVNVGNRAMLVWRSFLVLP